MKSLFLCLPIIIATMLNSSCTTFGTMGRAKVLPASSVQAGGTFEVQIGSAQLTADTTVPLPAYVLGGVARLGLGNNLEMGARVVGGAFPSIDAIQAGVDLKYQYLKHGDFYFAVQLSETWERFSLQGSPIYSLVTGLGAPIGYEIGKNELTFVPKIHHAFVFGEGFNPIEVWWLGASIAYHWMVTDSLELTPDVAFAGSDVGFNGTRPEDSSSGASLFQIGLSLNYQFDGDIFFGQKTSKAKTEESKDEKSSP